MAASKNTWNTFDGTLSATQDKSSDDSSNSSAGSQRSVSSTSTLSTASASSDSPFIEEKFFIKVPLHVAASLAHRGFDVNAIGKFTWRDESPLHPRNWSLTRKMYDTAVICFLETFTTLVSNTGSSTAAAGAADLGLSKEIALICFTITFLLAQAMGGLVLPPVAETFGGRNLYISAAAVFTLSCILMAAHPNLPTVVTGRLVCGFMSALPSTVAVSSFENMFDFRARIWVFHIWISCAVSALGVGPAVATYISTSSLGWQWVFSISAIVSGISILLSMEIKESRPSVIIRREIKAATHMSGFKGLFCESTDTAPSFGAFCQTSLILPVRLFFTEPIVFLASIMASTSSAVIYLLPEAIPVVFKTAFGVSLRQCSQVNLAVPVGVLFTFLPRLYDIRVSNDCRRRNFIAQPQDRIFGFLVAAPTLAVAFWWFGLTIPPMTTGLSPWVPIASLALVGFSVVEFDTVLAGYLTDTHTSHAASANASLSFLQAVLSGVVPLFGHSMFAGLGLNNARFVLAGFATLYCGVAVLFAKYGPRIRLSSKFAQHAIPRSRPRKPLTRTSQYERR